MKTFILLIIITLLTVSIIFADVVNYEEAISMYKKGDYKKASELFKKYVKQKPDPCAYYLLGYSYYKMKKYSEAAKYFNDAYIIEPSLSPSCIKSK